MKKKILSILIMILALCTCMFTLTACGENEPSHAHSYDTIITSPKCGKQGYTIYFCVCGDYYIDDYVDALTHSYTNYVYNNDAKCEKDGTKTASCDNGCGTKNTINATGTALRHSFTRYYSDKNATYEKDGTKTANCDNGCGEKDTIADVGSMLIKDKIRFSTLTVDGLNVYGKVSNATTEFVFYEEIFVSGNATYVVDDDKSCSSPIASKTVDLVVGDNTFYVLETVGNNVKLYTVTIHRREMFTVTFNTNGGIAVDSQIVEEDSFATTPITSKTGYTFNSWDYDFSKPVTSDITINASWTANTNTPYKVEYYLQNLENDNYALTETADKTGTTNTTANAEIKTFTHFTHKASSTDSGNIVPNGSTVLKVYYTRDKYTVTFDGNGGTLVSGNVTQTVKYGGSVTAPIFEKEGHSFVSFDKTNYANINESFTATANWKVNQYSITILYGNGQEKIITQDYGTAITEKLPTLEEPECRPGYIYEWDNDLPLFMPSYNFKINAVWISIFELSGNKIIGLTAKGKTLANIVIPEQIDGINITEIGWEAFHSFNTLKNIEIPNSIINIGGSAFYNCGALESVTIPNSVVSIGSYAFYNCNNLKSLTIGESVQNIYREAFRGCAALEQVNFNAKKCSDTITDSGVSTEVFTSAGSLGEGITLKFGEKVTRIPAGLFSQDIYYKESIIKKVEFGKTINSIGKYAFSGVKFLGKVVIPNSVCKIELGAFSQCVIYELTIPFIGSGETSHLNFGYIFGNDSGNASVPVSLYSVEITAGWISYEAFYFCRYIKNIVIHDNVRLTGNNAFSECHALTTIVLPSTTNITRNMFYNCKSLTNVLIPSSVKYVHDYAFYNCSSLTSVFYRGTATEWANITISSGNAHLNNSVIYLYVENEAEIPSEGGNYWRYVNDVPVVWNVSNGG